MPPRRSFFWGGIFFLCGVALAGCGVAPLFVLVAVLACAGCAVAFWKSDGLVLRLWIAGLLSFVVVGSLWYRIDDASFRGEHVPFGRTVAFFGTVAEDPVAGEKSQQAVLAVDRPFRARIELVLPRYPEVAFGDVVAATGTIASSASATDAAYLEAQGIRGTAAFPELAVVGKGGNPAMAALLAVKHGVVSAIRRFLPGDESALMAGLVIGYRADFPKALTDEMRKSGTTHLVALSGYNISIVAAVVALILSGVFARRWAVVAGWFTIVGFTVMTGASPSAVRAAIIAVVASLAVFVGRRAHAGNVILATALAMVAWNPKLLLSDVGFRLSMLAFLGIVYIYPALRRFLLGEKEPHWAVDAFLVTLAAQLATIPALVGAFGGFAPVSLVSNILILEAVPLTMALGCALVLSAPLAPLAASVAAVASVFLRAILWAIAFFAGMGGMTSFGFAPFFVAAYYAALVWFSSRYRASALAASHKIGH